MQWKVVEELLVPRQDGHGCADIIVHGRSIVGVIDGSTAKDWQSSLVDGCAVARCIAEVLESAMPEESFANLVKRISIAVAMFKGAAGLPKAGGVCATFAAMHLQRREVWRIGDPWVRIGNNVSPPLSRAEDIIAAARSLVVRAALASGKSIEELRVHDPGRTAILELLRAAEAFRNKLNPLGFAAIDGDEIPASFLECFPVPDGAEVVLATDGYLDITGNLAAAESNLQDSLTNDPLLALDFPHTKGWMTGANSFDDRAYIRLVPKLCVTIGLTKLF